MQRYNIRKGVARKSKNCLSKNKRFLYDPLPSLRPPSRNLISVIRRRSRVKPGMRFFLFFSLYRQRGRTKRELVARSGSDKITIHRSLCNSVTTRHSSSKLDSALAAPSFHSFAAGLASLKQVLAMPSAPCSIIGFYPFPSRYRNVIRSKDEDYPSFRPPSRNLIRVFPQQIADQVRDEGNQVRNECYPCSRCSNNF